MQNLRHHTFLYMYIARYGVVKNDYITFTLIFNNNEEKRIADG
jgi:hypothetical protein